MPLREIRPEYPEWIDPREASLKLTRDKIAQLEESLLLSGVDQAEIDFQSKKFGTADTPGYLSWLRQRATDVGAPTPTPTPTPTPAVPGAPDIGVARTDILRAMIGGIPEEELERGQIFQEFYTAPTETEIQQRTQDFINQGFTASRARSMAEDVLEQEATQLAQARGEEELREREIQQYITQYPEEMRGLREELAGELGGYTTRLFEEEVAPRTSRFLAARGLTGGTLEAALARGATGLERERQAQLAGLGTEAGLRASQLEYENLLRQAQQAGYRGQELAQYGRGLREMAGGRAFGAAQAGIGREWQESMQRLQFQQQQAMIQQQREYEAQRAYQQAGGGFLADILRGGIGAGVGALTPYGAGRGFLTGFTGTYLPRPYTTG